MPGMPPNPLPSAGMMDASPGDLSAASSTPESMLLRFLDANFAILQQFRLNMAAFNVQENTLLLVQFRDNIQVVMGMMETMGGVMAQLPPLPVK
jgi:hypothetical protein